MNQKKLKILLYLTLVNIFYFNNLYATKVDVFCSTLSMKWEWLKIDDKIYSVEGKWEKFLKKIDSNYFYEIDYFKINGGIHKIREIESLCIKNFGNSYILAQPATGFFSNWTVFGENSEFLSTGFTDTIVSCPKCYQKRANFSVRIFINSY
ncbi:hypothetical protein GCL60_07980 [Silvanigrella paludirubra]|uniref:Uncharacterized protein n=1 Tax=Silvanigrella paludirubra TaxID=2499159 RepID=A0A6N6VRQ5_9BACT|nr:hypothetical protein [Silvanigrella paludirubra]KAB8038792.1 hypothetical protein GCL60_07980 [Silvanigrella paludirubra]